MQNDTSYQKGLMAEEMAKRFLIKRGSKIIAERYKTAHGEIDVIAFDQKRKELLFIEVKSRKNRDEAAYAVSVKNQTRVRDAALRFLQEKPDYQNKNMRFDVILIHDYNEIEYIENAF